MSHATAGRHSSGSRVNRTNARPKEICRRVAQPCVQGLCPSETRAFSGTRFRPNRLRNQTKTPATVVATSLRIVDSSAVGAFVRGDKRDKNRQSYGETVCLSFVANGIMHAACQSKAHQEATDLLDSRGRLTPSRALRSQP